MRQHARKLLASDKGTASCLAARLDLRQPDEVSSHTIGGHRCVLVLWETRESGADWLAFKRDGSWLYIGSRPSVYPYQAATQAVQRTLCSDASEEI